MSTRCTIIYEQDEATGQEIHHYEVLLGLVVETCYCDHIPGASTRSMAFALASSERCVTAVKALSSA